MSQALRTRQEEMVPGWAAGALTLLGSQLLAADAELRTRVEDIERRIAAETRSSVLGGLVEALDVAAVWGALPLDRRRAVLLQTLVAVRAPRSRRGRLPGGAYFDPTAVRFEWTATQHHGHTTVGGRRDDASYASGRRRRTHVEVTP